MRDRSAWTWHIGAGVVVLVLLGLHMAIMHLNPTFGFGSAPGAKPTDWASVFERMQSLFFAVTYVILLGAALYHGFYGLRTILFELNPGRRLRTAINATLITVGVGLFLFGSWAALAAPGAATSMGA